MCNSSKGWEQDRSAAACCMSRRSLFYIAYDRYPAPKGAATHISAFVSALRHQFDELDLVTVAAAPTTHSMSVAQSPPSGNLNFRHTELPAVGPSMIERVLHFRTQLRGWWSKRKPDVAHVRSIFEGYPIARRKSDWCKKLVFEVNGLPSIELKYHYPKVADDRELMAKLLTQENACLEAADLIITVSDVNAAYLKQRGADPDRICVIPNGVDLNLFTYRSPQPVGIRPLSLLYSGTLTSWQGVNTAIEALALVRREMPAKLRIIGSGRPAQIRTLNELASRLGVADHVKICDGTSQMELARAHHEADVILIPLLPNDRNLLQGCCPLKVLEAMASGTPLIASDMPVVSCLVRNGIDGQLVRPGSAKSIKDGLLRFRDDPHFAQACSENARTRIENEFTWDRAGEKLRTAYQTYL